MILITFTFTRHKNIREGDFRYINIYLFIYINGRSPLQQFNTKQLN